jgi:hypothetical protein
MARLIGSGFKNVCVLLYSTTLLVKSRVLLVQTLSSERFLFGGRAVGRGE